MKKVLLTGGVGFIGYHLSKYLLNKRIDLTILDNFSDFYSKEIKLENAKELKKLGANIIKGSILDKGLLNNKVTENYNCIFHFAAQPGVRFSTSNPEISLRVNIEGTSNILNIAKEKKISKVVVASSSSVFGIKEYLPIDENHSKKPISIYGLSKFSSEELIKVYRYLYSFLDISIIRPFTVVGPRQRPDMAINTFITSALKNRKIIIFGDGKQTRDWTNVDNIVQATYLIAIKKEAKNEDFNIGSGIKTSVNEVLELISEITKRKLDIEYLKFDKADVKETLADISKAKKLLGYNPKKTLKDAIEDFIVDYPKIANYL